MLITFTTNKEIMTQTSTIVFITLIFKYIKQEKSCFYYEIKLEIVLIITYNKKS